MHSACKQCNNKWSSVNGLAHLYYTSKKESYLGKTYCKVEYNIKVWKHYCKKCGQVSSLSANWQEVEFVSSNFAVAMMKAMGIPGVKKQKREKGKNKVVQKERRDHHYATLCEACKEGVCPY